MEQHNKRRIAVCLLVLLLSLCLGGAASAHELWIEVEKSAVQDQLKVEVLWGHIRDFLDRASHEDYQLFVRKPSGTVQELSLDGIGVQARAFLDAGEKGEYVFWALRQPGTYTPGDGITTLSVQLAKAVYQHGTGSGTAADPAGILLEIVPQTNLTAYKGGTFKGSVLMEGTALAGAAMSAYGPAGETLTGESAADGTFAFALNSPGIWLIKANIQDDEKGSHDGQDYGRVSRTTTLLLSVPGGTAAAGSPSPSGGSAFSAMLLPFIIGLLLGGAATLFITGRSKKPN